MTNASLKKRLIELKSLGFFDNLIIKRGIEKEFFRVNNNGYISKKSHPESLGSALTNKFITTDFAEAQVELVTPKFENINDLYDFLYSLHVFVAQNINKNEMLWPFSMPPEIKDESDINIGFYHKSNIGLLKHVYRRGLKVRYGPTMQCVSGMHYNFSIETKSLKIITKSNNQKDIDTAYLGLIRNFKRLFWFILMEFGQTNVVNNSFVKGRKHKLEKFNYKDLYFKDSTSLRMSDIGYQSKAQKNLNIKYNSLEEFLKKIRNAIKIPYKDFDKRGLLDPDNEYQQISSGIIQIENEYYDSIRPKRSASNNLRPYNLLKEFGIEYLEIRGLDISPDDITGISIHQMKFIDLFLIYCLIKESPKMSDLEKEIIDSNDMIAIYHGRNKNTEIFMNEAMINIFDARNDVIKELRLIASFFENKDSLLESIDYIVNSEKGKLPNKDFHSFSLEKAKKNIDIFRSDNSRDLDSIKKEAELSLDELNKIPNNSKEEMNDYVKNYNSNL